MRRSRLLQAHAALLAVLLGCPESTTPTVPLAPSVGRVVVTPDRASLASGERQTLRARVLDLDGKEVTDLTVRWSLGSPALTFVSPAPSKLYPDERFGAEVVVEGGEVDGTGFRSVEVKAMAARDEGAAVSPIAEYAIVTVVDPRPPATLAVGPAGPLSLAVGEVRHLAAFPYSAARERRPMTQLQFASDNPCVELLPAERWDQQVAIRGKCEGAATVSVSAGTLSQSVAVTVVPAARVRALPSDLDTFANLTGAPRSDLQLLVGEKDLPFVFFQSNLDLLLARWAGTGWDVMLALPWHPNTATTQALGPQSRPAFAAGRTFYLYDPDAGRFRPEVIDSAQTMEVVTRGTLNGRPGYYPQIFKKELGSPSALMFDATGAAHLLYQTTLRAFLAGPAADPTVRSLATRTPDGWTTELLPFEGSGESVRLAGREGLYFTWPKNLHEPAMSLHDTTNGLALLSFP